MQRERENLKQTPCPARSPTRAQSYNLRTKLMAMKARALGIEGVPDFTQRRQAPYPSGARLVPKHGAVDHRHSVSHLQVPRPSGWWLRTRTRTL